MDLVEEHLHISGDELIIVPENVREKLIIGVDNLFSEMKQWKDAADHSKVDQEQLVCEYEQKLKEVSDELELKRDGLVKRNEEFFTLEEKHKQVVSEKDTLQEKYSDLSLVQAELSNALTTLEGERNTLSEQMAQRSLELQELVKEKEEWKNLETEVRRKQLDLTVRLEEVQSKEATFKAREDRWTEDRSTYERQIQWLNQQLREASEKILNSRRDMSAKMLNLQSELQARTDELTHVRENAESMKSSVENLTASNEKYIDKLKQSHEDHIKMEQLYRNELQTQKRLIDLYKEKSDDAEKKDQELLTAVSDMQNMLKLASEDMNKLETEKNEVIGNLEKEKEDLSKKIADMSRELEDANHLLEKFRVKGLTEEELKQMNPSAAAALGALKRGRSLTQIYTEYMQVVEERDSLNLENKRLSEYMREVVEEMEEKGPVLKRQQEEFLRCQATLGQMTTQFNGAMDQLVELQKESDELRRKSDYYQRENRRLKQTCHDLGKQVHVLLREVETGHGALVRDDDQDETSVTSSSTRNISASDVISDHLISFRSIVELQEQNQKLIQVARDLGEKLEAREANMQPERLSELQSQLETTQSEVDRLRRNETQARQQVEMAERQRDMFKVLLDHSGHESGHEVFDAVMATPDGKRSGARLNESGDSLGSPALNRSTNEATRRLEESTVALKELQEEFRKYREDKGKSDEVYTQTVDSLRKESSECGLRNARLTSQLEFTHEKYKTLETNVANYKKEINVLREMTQKYTATMAKQETELSNVRGDLQGKMDRLSHLEVEVGSLRVDNQTLRAIELRLREEVDAARKQKHTQQQLLSNIQAIQSNLEHRDSTERIQLTQRSEKLQREVDGLRAELDRDRASSVEHRTSFAEEVCQTRTELEASRERIAVLETEIREAREALEVERSRVTDLSTSMGSVDLHPRRTSSVVRDETVCGQSTPQVEGDSDRIHLLEIKLKDTERERDALQHTSNRLTTQLEEYMAIAEGAERQLEEQANTMHQLQESLCAKAKAETERCEFLQSQLALQEKERQTLMNDNIKITEEAHQMNADLRRQLQQGEQELEAAVQRREEALALEASAKDEIQKHLRMATDANEKYQRELRLHAADMEEFESVKNELMALQAVQNCVKEEVTKSKKAKEKAEKILKEKEEQWTKAKDELSSDIKALREQNSTLQDQLVQLNRQVLALRKLTEGKTEVPFNEEDFNTSENLLQLVKYLRQQKEIAEASNEVSSSEGARLVGVVSSLEHQVEELRQALNDERKSSQLEVETAHQHAELIGRVEQLNMVTESNRLLRQESENLSRMLKEAESRAESLKATLEPLEEQLRHVTDERNSLEMDKRSLEEEKNRWKDRCNKLIESAERMDPEQYKKACSERDELSRTLNAKESDLVKRGKEVADLQTRCNQLEQKTRSQDETIKRLSSEHDVVKRNLIAKQKELEQSGTELADACARAMDLETTTQNQAETIAELNQTSATQLTKKENTILQLREIARKYKNEAESLKKDSLEEGKLKESLSQSTSSLNEANAKLKKAESELSNVSEQLNTARQRLTDMDSALASMRQSAALAANSTPTEVATSVSRLAEERTSLRDQVTQLQEDQEGDERFIRVQIIESQYQRLQKENAELKKNLAALTSASAQAGASGSGLSSGAGVGSPAAPAVVSCAVSESTGLAVPTTAVSTVSTVPEEECSVQRVSPSPSPVVIRAAASVQPVVQPPGPHPQAVSPPAAGLTGPRQTAEIRPMPSVATVMPTPAQEAPVGADSTPSTTHLQMGPVVRVSLPVEQQPVSSTSLATSDTPTTYTSEPGTSDAPSTSEAGPVRGGLGKRRREDYAGPSTSTNESGSEEGTEAKRPKAAVIAPASHGAIPLEEEEVPASVDVADNVPQIAAVESLGSVAIEMEEEIAQDEEDVIDEEIQEDIEEERLWSEALGDEEEVMEDDPLLPGVEMAEEKDLQDLQPAVEYETQDEEGSQALFPELEMQEQFEDAMDEEEEDEDVEELFDEEEDIEEEFFDEEEEDEDENDDFEAKTGPTNEVIELSSDTEEEEDEEVAEETGEDDLEEFEDEEEGDFDEESEDGEDLSRSELEGEGDSMSHEAAEFPVEGAPLQMEETSEATDSSTTAESEAYTKPKDPSTAVPEPDSSEPSTQAAPTSGDDESALMEEDASGGSARKEKIKPIVWTAPPGPVPGPSGATAGPSTSGRPAGPTKWTRGGARGRGGQGVLKSPVVPRGGRGGLRRGKLL